MKLNTVFYSGLFLVLFSCTIIEESDLITPADFEKIRLTRIELVQEANNVRTNATMKVSWDSAISEDGPQGTLVRSLGFELKGYQGKKLKFRSGEGSALILRAKFYTNGDPFRFDVIKSNAIAERYVFRYNAQGKLARLTFFLGIDNVITSDTILYNDAGKINAIQREEFSPVPSGNISVEYQSGGVLLSRFTTASYQFQMNSGNCSFNAQMEQCFAIYRMPAQGGGGPNSNQQVNFNYSTEFDQLASLSLREQRFNQQNGNTRKPDTYYFHPLLLLDGHLDNGKNLLMIYMTDWYEPGEEVTGDTPSFDESVTFNYIYGL